MKKFYVYILSNYDHTVFYIGVTSNLVQRIDQHKTKAVKGFTSNYNVNKLLWFTEFSNSIEAFNYEKKIKRWKREWKFNLIKEINPEYKDLSDDFD